MPFLAPALVAVGTAVGTGATVAGGLGATALVAGGIGTVLSVAGMVTKNKLLSQIGMGFGIAGAVAGIGGMAASAGLFSGAAGNASAAAGQTAGGWAGGVPGTVSGTGASQAAAVSNSLGGLAGSAAPSVQSGAIGGLPIGRSDLATMFSGSNPLGSTPATSMGAVTPVSNIPVSNVPLQAPDVLKPTAQNAWGAGFPNAPTPTTPGLLQQTPNPNWSPTGGVDPSNIVTTLPPPPASAGGFSLLDWFNKLPPAIQATFVNTAGQGVAGAVGGIFSSIQADRQAELLEQINRENRQYTKWQGEQAPGLLQYQHERPAGA